MNITVYLGSFEGNDPSLKQAVSELGTWIGESGNTLIFGGSKTGLMGILADSTLSAGGRVIGVEAQNFIDCGFGYDGLTELIVETDIPKRKTKMIELGNAFIAFPGGTGTLEEVSEVMTNISLGFIKSPCIFYNLNGYYEDMRHMLSKMVEMGLSTKERLQGIYFAKDLGGIKKILLDENLPSCM